MAMEKIPAEFRGNFSESTNKALDALPSDWPEVAYAIYPSDIPTEFANSSVPVVEGASYATAVAVLFAPQSVGNVSIASADITVPPLINPALFTNQADIDIMVAGIKRLRQALGSSAMTPILIGPETVPGVEVQTDEEIIEYLRTTVNPFQHAFASNKMGLANDSLAVVDSKGSVYGVKNCKFPKSQSMSKHICEVDITLM